jgi:hypothetical protein
MRTSPICSTRSRPPRSSSVRPVSPRLAIVTALRTLSEDLLAHLQYEEEHISDTLRTWTRWPGW